MTPNRELRLMAVLLGLVILWTGLALWYHRLWLEALSERTDELFSATVFLGRKLERETPARRYQRPQTTLDQETVTVTWPGEAEPCQGPSGDPIDGA